MKVPENSASSDSVMPKAGDGRDPISPAMNGWLQHRVADWPKIWAACVRRTHAWRIPPRWSARDWWEEIDAESVASACHAIRIFDPTRGPSLSSFVYHQILAGALSRYRQEWIYALRYGLSPSAHDHPGGTDDVEDRFAADQEEKNVLRLMTDLPERDRR